MKHLLNSFSREIQFLYEALTKSTDNYIYIGNLQTDEFLLSANMAEDFGYEDNTVCNFSASWLLKIHEQDVQRFSRSYQDLLDGVTPEHDEVYQVRNHKGAYIWVHCRGSVRRDPVTLQPLYFAGAITNLERQGLVDNITGLYSFEKCQDLLDQTLSGERLGKGGFLLFGIDDFTSVNMLNTHMFGDMVLRSTVLDIQKLLPPKTNMYRYDGDQFVIIYYDACRADMSQLYYQLQEYTMKPHILDDVTYQFTISAGIVMFPDDSDNCRDLIRNATIVMKNIKETGKNRCQFYTDQMMKTKMREQKIQQEMGASIRNHFKGFRLVFQPINNLNSMKLIGAEALLRFDSIHFGHLSPLEFIPILEKSRMMVQVGKWVIEQSIRVCRQWIVFVPDFVMNINVSLSQPINSDFISFISEKLAEYALDANHIVLELTESYLAQDEGSIYSALNQLRTMNLKIAIDDFGTGYSSLGRLQQTPTDIVKIDRTFITSLKAGSYNHDFVKSVIHLCHNAGIKVCVEGVETKEDLKNVSLLYADTMQGYYVSKPLSAEDFHSSFFSVSYDWSALGIPGREAHTKSACHLVDDHEIIALTLDALPLCISIWNDAYETVLCNDAAVKLFQLRSKKEYQDRFYELSPEYQENGKLSFEQFREKIASAFAAGSCTFQWMYKKLNGELMPAEITMFRIPYKNQCLVAGHTRDLRPQAKLGKSTENTCAQATCAIRKL